MLKSTLALLTVVSLFSMGAKAEPIQSRPVDSDWWRERHLSLVESARTDKIDVLFLGDSITDGWHNEGHRVWDERIAALQGGNFGIGGDRVENVLWRVQNGEVDGLAPRAVVLLIGTNNLFDNTAEEINAGHALLLGELRKRLPAAKILTLAVFPRVDEWSVEVRDKISSVNLGLSQLADGQAVTYLDIGIVFKAPDGGISKEIMFDGLHLTDRGYQLWADAMMPELRKLLGN